MASSGKKGKKNKGKTLALNDFLQETPGAIPTLPIRKSTLSWADEVEDAYESFESRSKTNVVLPTAPKASRGLDDYSSKVPQQPPYIAYLTNLPYDVDKDEIADLFSNLKIANMRIPKDDRSNDAPKLRGFGYVEFEDRDSLISALSMPDCILKNRRIRIDVASGENDRKRGGRMDMGRERPDRPEVSMGDWRSGPRVAESSDSERRGGFRDRDRDSFRDAPSERSGDWRSSDRPAFRDTDRGFGGRDGDRGRFERESRDGDRGRFERESRFGPRRDDRNGGFTRRDELPPEKTEPRTRPKLNLAPRTKPLETPAPAQESNNAPASAPVPAASIFGSAKPVDTSARERQIEERLAKESEKPPRDSSSDSRREGSRRYFNDRRSPRRDSPGRLSPRYRSARSGSPRYRRRSREGRRYSPSPRRDSYDRDRRDSEDRRRDYSPRRDSPGRGSPDRRKNSPVRRRESPERRRDSPYRRESPGGRRRDSPENRNVSPEQERREYSPRRDSPERRPSPPPRGESPPPRSPERKASVDEGSLERKKSPERRKSPVRRKGSPDRRKVSPERRKKSPERRKNSPSNRKPSPDKKKGPSDRKAGPKKNEEKKGAAKSEKPAKEKDKPKQREHERELPKLKEPEPPNFASSNKFAFLTSEEDSDN